MTKLMRRASDAMVSAIIPRATATAACTPRYNIVCRYTSSCGSYVQKSIYYIKASCDEILVRRCCALGCTADPHTCN